MKQSNKINVESIINAKDPSLIKHTLSSVSTEEILTFIKRLNFYIEHFKIINKINADETSFYKLELLNNMHDVLYAEISNRVNSTI